MGLLAVVNLDISKRDLEDVWDNLQSSLVKDTDGGIEPVAMGIIFETYDIIVFLWCEHIEYLTEYIINHMRSIKGVTETTVFFMSDIQNIQHEDAPAEPGLDGVLLLDVECGLDEHVLREVKKIGPEEEKTFTKFISHCLHSQNLDIIVGFKGINLYYLDQLFTKIRMVNGVIDIMVLMFQRFKTLNETETIEEKFPWFL